MKNLIYVNAGKNSQHKDWFVDEKLRNYKIFANYYEPEEFNGIYEDFKTYQSGYKYQCFYNLMFNGHMHLFDEFDYFWLPDNDMGGLEYIKINQLFELFQKSGYHIAQPSTLSSDPAVWSYYLNHRDGQEFRETTFVEIMCPIFTKEALLYFMPFFPESASGCGLDLLWSDYSRRNGKKIGVIDAIQVKHLMQFGGLWENLKKTNIDSRTEMEKIIYKYQVRWPNM